MKGSRVIRPRHLKAAIDNDEELHRFFCEATLVDFTSAQESKLDEAVSLLASNIPDTFDTAVKTIRTLYIRPVELHT